MSGEDAIGESTIGGGGDDSNDGGDANDDGDGCSDGAGTGQREASARLSGGRVPSRRSANAVSSTAATSASATTPSASTAATAAASAKSDGNLHPSLGSFLGSSNGEQRRSRDVLASDLRQSRHAAPPLLSGNGLLTVIVQQADKLPLPHVGDWW